MHRLKFMASWASSQQESCISVCLVIRQEKQDIGFGVKPNMDWWIFLWKNKSALLPPISGLLVAYQQRWWHGTSLIEASIFFFFHFQQKDLVKLKLCWLIFGSRDVAGSIWLCMIFHQWLYILLHLKGNWIAIKSLEVAEVSLLLLARRHSYSTTISSCIRRQNMWPWAYSCVNLLLLKLAQIVNSLKTIALIPAHLLQCERPFIFTVNVFLCSGNGFGKTYIH